MTKASESSALEITLGALVASGLASGLIILDRRTRVCSESFSAELFFVGRILIIRAFDLDRARDTGRNKIRRHAIDASRSSRWSAYSCGASFVSAVSKYRIERRGTGWKRESLRPWLTVASVHLPRPG